MTAREQLQTFDLTQIPTLDTAVLGALELFSQEVLPEMHIELQRPLVIGSVNAYSAAQIVFRDLSAMFADESSYHDELLKTDDYDGVVVMSASGGKHAVPMTESAMATGKPVYLITNNGESAAALPLPPSHVFLYSKNREPYTYNTSTYLGPIFAVTKEEPAALLRYLERDVSPRLLRNFENYSAVTFIIPSQFIHVRPMVRTKFDELFGGELVGRIFTEEEIKHAKTVITSGNELFIALGVSNTFYGVAKNRLHIPLPEEVDYAALLAITYFIIGKIQTAHPPYFKTQLAAYCQIASEIFGETINPIVE